jgi:polar amino acid transport system substrate-binding protein
MTARYFRSLLAGIAFVAAATSAPGHAQAEESVLEKVKKEGVLKACVAQIAPESFKDAKTGDWHGVTIDLLTELANWMKLKLEIVEVKWDIAVLSLKRGDCDLFGGSFIFNAPRAMEVNYIVPFYRKGVNFIVPKEAKQTFANPKDFNDPRATVAVVAGTGDHETFKRYYPKANLLALNVNSNVQIIEAVRRGDADAAYMSTLTIRWWLAIPENAAWAKMAFPDQDLLSTPNGWAVRYGDPDWKAFLDSFARWAVASGTVQSLYDAYFERANPFK